MSRIGGDFDPEEGVQEVLEGDERRLPPSSAHRTGGMRTGAWLALSGNADATERRESSRFPLPSLGTESGIECPEGALDVESSLPAEIAWR
jgi:hypothetical protein